MATFEEESRRRCVGLGGLSLCLVLHARRDMACRPARTARPVRFRLGERCPSKPTNLAFCCPDLETLVVGSLGRWHLSQAKLDIVGQPYHYPELPV